VQNQSYEGLFANQYGVMIGSSQGEGNLWFNETKGQYRVIGINN